jgi:hypothetical protein
MIKRFFKTLYTSSASKPLYRSLEAEKALNDVKKLWQKGQLKEALKEIDSIEQKFPSCSKAAKYYRGEIGVQLLEEKGVISKSHKL